MSSLYNKYRPKNFFDVIDQENVVGILKNAVGLDNIAHAYLFTGPKGTGKTTVARILAKAVNCENIKDGEPCNVCASCKLIESNENLDVTEIDAASHTGVDNIRELKENIHLAPSRLKYKVYVIDEVHMLSMGAFNALLKSLEEPPEFVIFVLATTEIHKIPATIISRCQRFNFKRLTPRYIKEKLKKISAGEKIKISDDALAQIASAAEGGMRDAESLLDQIINVSGKEIESKEVSSILGVAPGKNFYKLVLAIHEKNLAGGFEIVTSLVYSGFDMSQFLKDLIGYLREILVLKIDPDYEKDLKEQLDEESANRLIELAKQLNPAEIGKIIAELLKAKSILKDSPLPQLPLELALVRLIAGEGGDLTGLTPPPVASKTAKKIEEETKKEETKEETKAVETVRPEIFAPKKSDPAPERSESAPEEAEAELEADPAPKAEVAEKIEEEIEPKAEKEEPKESAPVEADQALPDIAKVNAAWPDLIKGVKKYNHSLWAVLQACQPLGIDKVSQSVIIKAKYNFHKSRLEDIANKKIVHEVAKNVIGSDCNFCYLLEDEIPKDLKEENSKAASKVMEEFGGELIL